MRYLDYREIRKHGTFRFPVAWYHENPRTPRYLMPFHWHDEYEIIRVLHGSFSLSLDGQIFRIREGECIIIPSGVIHGGTPEDCFYECILFDPSILKPGSGTPGSQFLQQIIDGSQAPRLEICPADSTAASIAQHLSEVITSKQSGYELATQGFLYILFAEMMRTGILVSVEREKKIPGERQVKTVLDYIANHYMEPLRLEDIASLACMNANYFCSLFKSFTGQSPMAYLNYYRIECACEKLTVSDISVSEAAWQCGFNDVGYFTRCFKKQKGVTPTRYMKACF